MNNLIKKNSNKIFDVLNVSIMFLIMLIIIIPIWSIVVDSFSASGTTSATTGFRWLPLEFSLENYKAVLSDDSIWLAFAISIAKTVIGVVTHVFFTAMVAYGMSKNYLMGRKFYTALGIGTMFFSGGMIPIFLLIKSLGLLNTFWVYIIPALFSYYDMIIIMNFFRELPTSLEESATIDGAGVLTVFMKIYLPLSKPVICTIALFNGVYQWNDYMAAKLYVTNESLYPIQMKLYQVIVQSQAQSMQSVGTAVIPTSTQSIQLATIVLATVPIVMVYPFLQKHFMAGMMLGAVKE